MPAGVSQRELAARLGVSVSTVSRALSDSSRVSPLTKQAVREAITALERAQSGAPRGKTDRTMIGVTHSHYSQGRAVRSLDTILEQVLGGVEIACAREKMIPYPWQQSALLLTEESDPFFEAVSGVIVSGGVVERRIVEAIQARGKPVVIIGGHVPELSVPSVAADSHRGAYLATLHLAQLGHRRIGLVNGPPETYTSHEKRSGYVTALTDCGLPVDVSLIRAGEGTTGFDEDVAERLTDELLSLDDPPTALIFASDSMARASYRVAYRHGRRIPDDLSIVGFHDDRDARLADPPMSSVRVDRTQWGLAATEVLIHLLDGMPSRSYRLLLPVELVLRSSTGPAPSRS